MLRAAMDKLLLDLAHAARDDGQAAARPCTRCARRWTGCCSTLHTPRAAMDRLLLDLAHAARDDGQAAAQPSTRCAPARKPPAWAWNTLCSTLERALLRPKNTLFRLERQSVQAKKQAAQAKKRSVRLRHTLLRLRHTTNQVRFSYGEADSTRALEACAARLPGPWRAPRSVSNRAVVGQFDVTRRLADRFRCGQARNRYLQASVYRVSPAGSSPWSHLDR
jgi:hypothetical protein